MNDKNTQKTPKQELPTPYEVPLMQQYEAAVDYAMAELAKHALQVSRAQEILAAQAVETALPPQKALDQVVADKFVAPAQTQAEANRPEPGINPLLSGLDIEAIRQQINEATRNEATSNA